MAFVWLIVSIVLIATVLAIFWVVSIRHRRLQSKLRIEVENLGNMDSRYQLKADVPLGGLLFEFLQNGQPLQTVLKVDEKEVGLVQPAPAGTTRRPSSDSGTATKAIGFSGALGSVLTGIGSLLPDKIGKPFIQAGSKLYEGASKASRAQSVSREAAALGAGSRSPGTMSQNQADLTSVATGTVWAETPSIKPGEKLTVEIRVKASYVDHDTTRIIHLQSCASEGPRAQMVTAHGEVRIRGGFLSHKFYPPFVVIGFGAMLLGGIYWLVRIGALR